MKKNIMMRLSAVLLVAVLLTTCVISGTWAKYTKTGAADETARVAAFGVNIAVSEVDYKEYQATDLLVEEKANTITSAATTKVLAPGSGVKFSSFTITGTPEVAVALTYTATLTLNNWTVGGNDYCPLVFVINNVEYKIDYADINNVAELKAAVEEAITDLSKKYPANTDLETNNDLTISCYWPFSVDGDHDVKDTALGDANNANIQLVIGCTVTQIDEYTPAP